MSVEFTKFTDPAESNRYLEWRGNEGWRDGFKRFEVVKEKHGWRLYRFSTTLSGVTSFKSKEAVKTRAGGKAYAEALARLANFSPL